jgi:hypothetical protein
MRRPLTWMLCLLVLSACQRAPAPAATAAGATPEPAAPAAAASAEKPASGFFSMFSSKPAEAPAALGDFKIVSVTLGSAVDAEQQVPVSKSVFGRYDRIYAAVLSTGQHQGLKLSAKWTTADGQLVAESEQALVPTSATVTTFSLKNGEMWPVGKYQLVVSVDQLPQSTVPFEVR